MITTIIELCSFITGISAVLSIIIKPIRDKLFGLDDIREGQKCMLRSDMLRIYYCSKAGGNKIHQYELENFLLMYKAYKAMKGNSFIDTIHLAILEMEVIA